jgi:hypothetical protein
MVNKSDHSRRRERRREEIVDSTIFAVVPMPPLGKPTLSLRSNSHRRLKDLGPPDSSDEEEDIPKTSQSVFESTKESSARRAQNGEIAKILRKISLAAGLLVVEKDDRGSVRDKRSKSHHSRSSERSSSQRTTRIDNRRPEKFNDRVESFLNDLKEEHNEQR